MGSFLRTVSAALLAFLSVTALATFLTLSPNSLQIPDLKGPVNRWPEQLAEWLSGRVTPEELPSTPSAPVTIIANPENQTLQEENAALRLTIEDDRQTIRSLENQVAVLEKTLQSISNPVYIYTGEDLFAEVNKYRRDNKLSELSKDYQLCYLASYRLNQLLPDDKLDNHKGFDDFKPAEKFKYELVGENLAQGYTSASDVVYKGWVGSPGHHLLLSDPRLTLGCTATSRGIAVLIAGKEH